MARRAATRGSPANHSAGKNGSGTSDRASATASAHAGTDGDSTGTPAAASAATAWVAAGTAAASRLRWNRASSFASCEEVVSLHPRQG